MRSGSRSPRSVFARVFALSIVRWRRWRFRLEELVALEIPLIEEGERDALIFRDAGDSGIDRKRRARGERGAAAAKVLVDGLFAGREEALKALVEPRRMRCLKRLFRISDRISSMSRGVAASAFDAGVGGAAVAVRALG